ncbi:MAG: sugar kinase [Deltaproteobacteria bacterium]|nr:sugar kinase [Deltaproteobacteria bacterium]
MSKNQIPEVYGLGQCSLDYFGLIKNYPPADSKCEFTGLAVQGGGPVATALAALSRWGVHCAFAGVIGDDAFGRQIQASLEMEGIDLRGLLVRQGFESQFAFIAVEPGPGRRTIFWQRPTGPPPRPEELDLDLIRRAKVFHTDGLFPEAALAGARAARAVGVPVVVDAGSLRDGMLDLARLSDYFIASASFARSLVGKDDPLAACREMAALGPGLVGVTLGKEGYVALDRGRLIRRPAYPVAAVDTTGCGDVFHAGFIYGLLQGWTMDRSLDWGAWAASRVALQLGGRTGIPPLPEWLKG